jgi:hypothetical protein
MEKAPHSTLSKIGRSQATSASAAKSHNRLLSRTSSLIELSRRVHASRPLVDRRAPLPLKHDSLDSESQTTSGRPAPNPCDVREFHALLFNPLSANRSECPPTANCYATNRGKIGRSVQRIRPLPGFSTHDAYEMCD